MWSLKNFSLNYSPQRIVCLTDETTETLYLLEEDQRIVGISGFSVRPKQARKEKQKVSTFLEANVEEILDLKPDLVIGYSDIQANIAKQLIERGVTVWINNYRNVQGILKMIFRLGALVGKKEKAFALIEKIKTQIQDINSITQKWPTRPTVYFEEWDEPIITSIQWVSEIIAIAGGIDLFPENSQKPLAKDRIIVDHREVVLRNPDIILASWCGKKFKKEKMLARPQWTNINAVKNDQVFEIKSEIILQPGPAALLDGLPKIHGIMKKWQEANPPSSSYTF